MQNNNQININQGNTTLNNDENHNHIKLTSMKIAHSNINGLRNKIDDISVNLSEYDIICVSETKLNEHFQTTNLLIDSYHNPIRKDRNINNGGGLLIYIKNNIFYRHRPDLESADVENIWVEIRSLKNKYLIGHFYRPPNATVDFWDKFDSTIEKASEENLDLIILGDLNHDILKTNSNSPLLRILSKYNLQNMINEPTRVTNTTSTCIDLLFTNHESIISDLKVLPPFNSDHSTITAEITYKTYKAQAYKKTIWKYDEADKNLIEEKFESQDWSFINGNDINLINETFSNKIMELADQSIPKVNFTYRPNNKPWMNSNIRRTMRQRDRLYLKAKNKNTELSWSNYRNKRNEVVEMIRNAKKSYISNLQTKLSDPSLSSKAWYRITNEITKLKNKHNPPPPLIRNGQPQIHPLDKAQTLNEHFVGISTVRDEPELLDNINTPDFNLNTIVILEQDVKDQLDNLNINKPGGPDEISPKLIKTIGYHLVKPLTLLFNRSLQLGQVPQQWKMANVSAIFKNKGNNNDPTNYRPISITSCLGKILEKIIFKYLYNYLEVHEILTKYQSGFRPNDSTTNQLLEIYHIILENLDKGKDIKFIFCDVSKAFDKVWHRGLLHKLKKYGINGNLHKWFESYVCNRRQRVINEGSRSTWMTTTAGVPQGSVLGPYLFLLYINDIVEKINTNIRLFADDTSLFTVIENQESIQLLNEDLIEIAQWSDDWLIILNQTKTNSMTFTRKKVTNWDDAKFNNVVIKDNKTHTHLGITFSSDATWGDHTQKIYEKAATRLNIMRMLKYDIDRKSLHQFYISFIRPTLEYGNIIWDNCTKQQSDLLESIQLDAARIITGLRKGTSHDILYKETGLCPLVTRRKHSKLIQFFKILNNEAPPYINDIVKNFNTHETGYNLRSSNLRHPIPRTVSYKNSFFIATTDLWNDLDPQLKNATSLYSFKQVLKKQVLQPPKHYGYGNRKSNILLCQLRNCKSQLNADLHRDHLLESPNCIHCMVPETRSHYLLSCKKYEQNRLELINWLISQPKIYETIEVNETDLLQGNAQLSNTENQLLFDAVFKYIHDTKRL